MIETQINQNSNDITNVKYLSKKLPEPRWHAQARNPQKIQNWSDAKLRDTQIWINQKNSTLIHVVVHQKFSLFWLWFEEIVGGAGVIVIVWRKMWYQMKI